MEHLKPWHELALDTEHREVHFTLGGFFTLDEMKSFVREMDQLALTLITTGPTMKGLGDLRNLVPQRAEVAEFTRSHLVTAQKAGLTHVAIMAPPLVRMQYRRLSEGLEVGFFDDKPEALAWLRG
ncbi:STAS/SEC14 domain-containing protein [Aurantiacibacter gangjinensis]|uniref:STAS/SEC14 domain-containing protein n=1 Tax=Aurantiacibacter gangjinensis TaxID=502682 RepID=A0A0G9MM30_9SPHN|nr:STAS/SEC14 domain-containing protein [Aurantiacibacter gangjinensis]KLE31747.1 hypothetical protein AAW01_09585 [Aurantiacibacter gangjinensis]